MNLLEETKFILKKYGIRADKSLGQNFLINEDVVNSIVNSSNINKEDLIIEIGPGLGTLTSFLLEKAGKVIAVELDKRMIEILTDRFKLYNNFKLINDDILKVNLNEVIGKNLNETIKNVKIVANLPYYITTPIIMKLLEENLKIDSINKVIDVNRNSFIPEPNVDSEVINLKVRANSPVEVENKELLFKLIKYAFMQRRKTFANAIENSGIFKNKEEILNILNELNINEKIRGEAISLDQFAQITNLVKKK